jgi:hypothetical protein
MAGRWAESFYFYAPGAVGDPIGQAQFLANWTANAGNLHIQASALGGQEMQIGAGTTFFKTLDHQSGWCVGLRFKTSSVGGTLDTTLYTARNNGAILLTLQVNTDGTLIAYAGNHQTVIGVTDFAIHADKWYYIEIDYSLSGTTNITATATVRLDGNTSAVISGSGATNVANTSLTSGTATVNNHMLGSGNSTATTYKDIYICDHNGGVNNTFLGQVTILVVRPNGDVVSQWTPNSGITHFNRVNDSIGADDDTTYVSDGTVGHQDIWDWEDIPGFSGTIKFVEVHMYARKDDEGSKSFQTVVGDTGTEAHSGDFFVSDNYVYYDQCFDTDPATGFAWTRTGFNTKRFGAKVTT